MIIDLGKFMAIWMIILTMFTCVAILAFNELRAFDDIFYAGLQYFQSALGSWDLTIYDGRLDDAKENE